MVWEVGEEIFTTKKRRKFGGWSLWSKFSRKWKLVKAINFIGIVSPISWAWQNKILSAILLYWRWCVHDITVAFLFCLLLQHFPAKIFAKALQSGKCSGKFKLNCKLNPISTFSNSLNLPQYFFNHLFGMMSSERWWWWWRRRKKYLYCSRKRYYSWLILSDEWLCWLNARCSLNWIK